MNILDWIILLFLLSGVLVGYKRGFILQVFRLFGFIIALMVAYRYHQELIPQVKEWVPYPFQDQTVMKPLWIGLFDTEMLFFTFVSFALLFFATKLALFILARLLNLVALLPGLHSANRWLGGMLGFVESALFLFIAIQLLSFLPWSTGQTLLSESVAGAQILQFTPLVWDYVLK